MTVRNGREFLSIPGPTTVPDEVLGAMHQPVIEIYSGRLVDITASCLDDLRRVFRTGGGCNIYTANGHGASEAVHGARHRRARISVVFNASTQRCHAMLHGI